MARYDRIARIEPPSRDDAFPGWLALRDLEGREREPELARRARLWFLAVRPLHRLLRHGLDGCDAASLARQAAAVGEVVAQLSTQDPARPRLQAYLDELDLAAPDALVSTAIDVGSTAETAGHEYAAEEFYRTALDLATALALPGLRSRALRSVARLSVRRGAVDHARRCLETAVAAGEAAGDGVGWAGAVADLAMLYVDAGDTASARSLVSAIEDRAAGGRDDEIRAIGLAAVCALELADGRTEAGMEAGWRAVELMPPAHEDRNRVLLDLASGFRRMALREAAESCYRIVAGLSGRPRDRIEAGVQFAMVAAEAGDAGTFRSRRRELMGSPDASSSDARLRAMLELGLGRGAMLLEDLDDARAHLGAAIAIARDARLDGILGPAEELLSSLERRAGIELGEPADPSAGVRRIAARVESLRQELAPAG